MAMIGLRAHWSVKVHCVSCSIGSIYSPFDRLSIIALVVCNEVRTFYEINFKSYSPESISITFVSLLWSSAMKSDRTMTIPVAAMQ